MKFGWMKILPFLMAVLLFGLALALWPTTHGELLAWINITLLILMALLVFRYGVRLVREREESRPGSRLRAKLVMALVGMLMVPSMILQLAASQMVERGMDVWFDVRVDTLLDRALGLAQGFYTRIDTELEHSLRNYMSDTALLSAMDDQNFSAIASRLSDIRSKEGWQSLQLFDSNERLIAGVDAESLSTLTAAPLSDAARSAMTLGRVVTETQQADGTESIVGYAPMRTPQGLIGLLRAEVELPENVVQTSRMVEEDYKTYRELETTRQRISLHRRDDGRGRRARGDAAEAAAPGHRILTGQEALQVHARAEGTPGAGQDQHGHIAARVELVDGRRDAGGDRLVDRVARLWAVDRDNPGPAVHFHRYHV